MQKGSVLSDRQRAVVFFAMLLLSWQSAAGGPDLITIIHSSEIRSNLEGAGPNAEYTPESPGDDSTMGGMARISSVIWTTKQKATHPVFVFDSGDFSMGSIYHSLFRSQAVELRLMGLAGYDAVTLGEHEFDMRPDGLAAALLSLKRIGAKVPQITTANAYVPYAGSNDQGARLPLLEVLKAFPLQRSVILRSGRVRVGVFGIMGRGAAATAARNGMRFQDPMEAARREVDHLTNESVDLIVCLHHAPLDFDSNESESMELARRVPQINVILAGHTQALPAKPVLSGQTIISSVGSGGRHLGLIRLRKKHGQYSLDDYTIRQIDDAVPLWADVSTMPAIAAILERARSDADAVLFQPRGYDSRTVLAETLFDLPKDRTTQGNLGDMLTDAMRWGVGHAESGAAPPVDVAFHSRAWIGAGIRRGNAGRIEARDAFRVVPFGVGVDGAAGIPLITFYLSGLDVKNLLEYSWADADDRTEALDVSGIRYSVNQARLRGSRVTGLWTELPGNVIRPLPVHSGPPLYRIAMSKWDAESVFKNNKDADPLSSRVVPKDRVGNPITNLNDALVDEQPALHGLQELRVWHAFFDYLRSFPDGDSDGIPDIPVRYAAPVGREKLEAGTAPTAVLSGGGLSNGMVVFGAAAASLGLFLLLLQVGRRLVMSAVLAFRRTRISALDSSK